MESITRGRKQENLARAFPRQAPVDEQLAFLLGYAVLAPSGHNTQPWLFDIHDDAIWLYADTSKDVPALDPKGREQMMSCGAALFHLRVSARHAGITPVVERFPDGYDEDRPAPVARFQLGTPEPPSVAEEQLFSAIRRRRTHREEFSSLPVPAADREALASAAREEGAALTFVEGLNARRQLHDMVLQANDTMMSDPAVRRELAAWTSRPGDEEGVLGATRGWSRWQTAASAFLLQFPLVRLRPWKQEAGEVRTAPVLAILSTPGDTEKDWLSAGEALARVLLLATSYGLGASFLNQPVKVPSVRRNVAALLPDDGYPQIILRMGGVSTSQPRTGRREPQVDIPEEGSTSGPS